MFGFIILILHSQCISELIKITIQSELYANTAELEAMPVMTKEKHRQLMAELILRYSNLLHYMECRDLKSPGEGLSGRRSYARPENMTATIGNEFEVSMCVEDFKAILSEIKKLK